MVRCATWLGKGTVNVPGYNFVELLRLRRKMEVTPQGETNLYLLCSFYYASAENPDFILYVTVQQLLSIILSSLGEFANLGH